jgi:hypothetical protein
MRLTPDPTRAPRPLVQLPPEAGKAFFTTLFPLVVLLLFLSGNSGRADTPARIPLDLQVHIFLKIMTYDRNLQSQPATMSFHVGILEATPSTPTATEDLKRVVGSLERKTFLGRKITVRTFKSIAEVRESPLPIRSLVILEETISDWPALESLARERLIMTFGVHPSHCGKPLAIVLVLEQDQPVITLNLDIARRSGSDFHANFLKHCRVRR